MTPGTPEWNMCIATVMDVLSKHVMDEEGQIFGRVEQVWDAARLEQVGAQMQKLSTSRARPSRQPAQINTRPTEAMKHL